MNKYFNSLRKIMWVVLPFCLTVSCSDAWEAHYSTDQSVSQNKSQTLVEKIAEYGEETDKFVQTLKTTMFVKNSDTIMSYYDYLNSDQVYTVWVPLESSISEADWAEYTNPNKTLQQHKDVGQKFIKNHIARYSYSIAYEDAKVRMLSKKRYSSLAGADATFAGVEYKTKNVPCKNGLLHFLDGTIEYLPTVYEYITEEESYKDNLGKFFLTYTVDEIDEERSIVSGVDDNGEPIYIDSVTYKYSILMNKFGNISEEDSNYTVILPTAEAWQQMYDSIVDKFDYSYSKYDDRYNDSLQNYITNNVLLTDMFFNMNINRKQSLATSTLYDKNDETSGQEVLHKYQDPYGAEGIFRAHVIDTIRCSNGQILLTDKWAFDADYIYNRTVKCETEIEKAVITPTATKSSIASFDRDWTLRNLVSGRKAMRVDGATGWQATYNVRDNLKGDYKVGVVIINNEFIPGVMEDQWLPFKFSITGNYFGVKDAILNPKNGRNAVSYTNTIKEFDEEGNEVSVPVDTVWITNPKTGEPFIMSVPQCDYDVMMDEARLTLNIKCTVTSAELSQGKYSTMAVIDCILLEPVSEE